MDLKIHGQSIDFMVGRVGIEPTTSGLKEAEYARSRYPVARNRMIT